MNPHNDSDFPSAKPQGATNEIPESAKEEIYQYLKRAYPQNIKMIEDKARADAEEKERARIWVIFQKWADKNAMELIADWREDFEEELRTKEAKR